MDKVGLVIEHCEKLEEKTKIPVAHETHRGRFLYSAPVGLSYFKRFKNLKINFDLSHWCCVAESLLADQEEAVNEAIKRAIHIHARVGHEQGPQITDLRLPIWEPQIQQFLSWWKQIWLNHKNQGKEFMTITPEFGPLPYAPLHQNGLDTYANIFEQNLLMRQRLQQTKVD